VGKLPWASELSGKEKALQLKPFKAYRRVFTNPAS